MFIDKEDYFGMEGTTGLSIKGSNENKTSSVYEARDEKGDVVAREIYGETSAPNCSFEVTADIVLSIVLGTVNSYGTTNARKFCMGKLGVKTTLGSPVTVEFSGEQVESGATTANSSTVSFGYLKLSRFHDAQIPSFGAASSGTFTPAFTLSGSGCYLNDTQIDIEADISKSTVNGVCVSHDVQNGRCTVQATIVQTDSNVPTVTAGEGWDVTSPLTVDSQDENQPTWKVTFSKPFASVHPVANA